MTEASLEVLSYEECLKLLRKAQVGRVAVVVDGFPVVLPVNYRLVETSGRTWIALKTRRGNVIEQAGLPAAFEIDGIDVTKHEGWSVLARGTLHHVDPDAADFRERFALTPWITDMRDVWLIIEPFAITGRRLTGDEIEWAFHPAGYL